MGSSKIRDKNKGGDEKRKSMPSEGLVPNIEDIQQIDRDSVELFRPVLSAACLSDQVECVKSLFSSVASDKHQIVSIVSVQWYFNLSLGSGLRKVISNCLNQIKDPELSDLVIEQIRDHARKILGDPHYSHESESDVIRRFLSAFDNFKLGSQAVLAESELLMEFLLDTLTSQMEELGEEDILAVERNKVTEEAGDTCRLLVHVVKVKCFDNVNKTSSNQFLFRPTSIKRNSCLRFLL